MDFCNYLYSFPFFGFVFLFLLFGTILPFFFYKFFPGAIIISPKMRFPGNCFLAPKF